LRKFVKRERNKQKRRRRWRSKFWYFRSTWPTWSYWLHRRNWS